MLNPYSILNTLVLLRLAISAACRRRLNFLSLRPELNYQVLMATFANRVSSAQLKTDRTSEGKIYPYPGGAIITSTKLLQINSS